MYSIIITLVSVSNSNQILPSLGRVTLVSNNIGLFNPEGKMENHREQLNTV